MIDLNQTIDWGSIDFSQVMAEDRGDNERNMDFLLKTRAGVQFVPVVEDDEIVDGCASPPRPATNGNVASRPETFLRSAVRSETLSTIRWMTPLAR